MSKKENFINKVNIDAVINSDAYKIGKTAGQKEGYNRALTQAYSYFDNFFLEKQEIKADELKNLLLSWKIP